MSEAVELDGWTHVNSGKVRDLYQSEDGRVLLMVTSDRISAYDYILPTEIPGKGLVLTGLSTWWMNKLDSIVGNHLLDEPVPAQVAGRAVVCKKLTMYPIECVVRGYLTGSGLAEYKQSGTVCEIRLQEGLTEASKLPEPIFTPAAKAELGEHDENISFERAADMVGRDVAAALRDTSIKLYSEAARIARERGVIIADTKFEFGVDPDSGELVLADEALTPDSSRFWPADQWVEGQVTPSFDKQYVRDWLTSEESGWDRASGEQPPRLPDRIVEATRQRYVDAYTLLTGQAPEPGNQPRQ